MRCLPVIAVLIAATGCRPPAIPANPTAREYTLYNVWLDQASPTFPRALTFTIDSLTLTLNQEQLQFQQCLPRRMQSIFDAVPAASLTSSSGNDWLSLDDGRNTTLHTPGSPLTLSAPTEIFRLSRVAFTRTGYDAYLWVEHRTCTPDGPNITCESISGELVHGKRSDGVWTFEDTGCQIIAFPS